MSVESFWCQYTLIRNMHLFCLHNPRRSYLPTIPASVLLSQLQGWLSPREPCKGPWRSPVKCQPTFFRLPGTLFRTLLTISCFIPPKTSQNHNTVLEKGCLSPIDWIVSNIFNLLGRKEFHFQGLYIWHIIRTFHSFHKLLLPGQVLQQRSKVLMDSSSKKGRFIDFVASKKEL